ncbi:MAG: glycosyltransferase 87 family protein [Actinomycetota bacterium]|nr:glycosyltransferase 87 family protein [Actinomycetota bacterium]
MVIAVWRPGFFPLIDIAVYRAAGIAVLTGSPLYTAPMVDLFLFTYTPFAGLMFAPLGLVSLATVKILATIVNLGCIVFASWMCWRQLGYRRNTTLGLVSLLSAGLFVWLEPVWTTVALGQINLVLLVLVLWDIGRKDRSLWKGVGIGIAAGIKLTPAILILYFVITRRFTAAAVSIATFVSTVEIGFLVLPSDAATYWGGTFLNANRVGPIEVPSNQSLNGMLARFTDTNAPSTWAWLLMAIPVGFVGMVVAAWAHRRSHELLGATLCSMTGTAVSPFSWEHHWVWFIPLTTFIAHLALSERSNPRRRLLLCVVYILGFNWLVSFPTPGSGHVPAAGLFFLDTVPWIEYVSRNVYLLAFAIALMAAIGYLRTNEISKRSHSDSTVVWTDQQASSGRG